MAKKRYTPEVIIRKLREAEVLQGQGKTIAQVVKHIGITEQTFFRWRKEYGGMRVDQAKWLRELEAVNFMWWLPVCRRFVPPGQGMNGSPPCYIVPG